MRETVHPDRMETGIEKDFQIPCGRIIAIDRPDVLDERPDHTRISLILLKEIVEQLATFFLDLLIGIFSRGWSVQRYMGGRICTG